MARLCLVVVLCCGLLAACTPAARDVAPPVPQAPAFTQLDLDSLVQQAGELPSMERTPELRVAPFAGRRPGIAASFARLITQDDAVVGNIYVNVYTDTLDTKRAFDDRVNILSTGALGPVAFATSPIGEEGVLWVNGDSTFLVYRRCHAYVNINLPASRDATLRYARALDARISPAVCG